MYLTVKELREALADVPDDSTIEVYTGKCNCTSDDTYCYCDPCRAVTGVRVAREGTVELSLG